MRLRHHFPAAFLLLLAACASQQQPPSPDSGLATDTAIAERGRTPFAGLSLETAQEGGARVAGMVAGPAAMAGVLQGDRILRIDDIEVDASRAHAMIAASSPGTTLSLQLMRGDSPMQIELEIDTRECELGTREYSQFHYCFVHCSPP